MRLHVPGSGGGSGGWQSHDERSQASGSMKSVSTAASRPPPWASGQSRRPPPGSKPPLGPAAAGVEILPDGSRRLPWDASILEARQHGYMSSVGSSSSRSSVGGTSLSFATTKRRNSERKTVLHGGGRRSGGSQSGR
ncbi:unnamed protein product, partial [Phaeothamnion confervicola]